MEHEHVIGLYHDADNSSLITLVELKNKCSIEVEIKKIIDVDPVYASIYHSTYFCNYKIGDYLDRRKSTNLSRFDYCPVCGNKIDWKKMREDNAI